MRIFIPAKRLFLDWEVLSLPVEVPTRGCGAGGGFEPALALGFPNECIEFDGNGPVTSTGVNTGANSPLAVCASEGEAIAGTAWRRGRCDGPRSG